MSAEETQSILSINTSRYSRKTEITVAKPHAKYPQLLVKGFFTTLLLLLVLTRVDLDAVYASWRRFSISGFLVAGIMYFFAWAVASYKWKLLLPQHSWLELMKINFIGQYYSVVFPGQIAGEVVKAYRLGRGRPDAEQVAASVIIDRLTGLLALFMVALGGAIFSSDTLDRRVIWALGAVLAAGLLALFSVNIDWWSRLLRSLTGRFERVGTQVGHLLDAWQSYLDQLGRLFWNIVLGICFQLIATLINIHFARQLGIHIGFAQWCWIFGVISVTTMLPLSVAGIGLREGSFVGVLSLVGIAPEVAIALSFAVFSLLLAGGAVGAVLDWVRSDPKV